MLDIIERVRQYEPFFNIWRLDNPPVILGRGNSGVVFLIHDGEIEAALKVIALPRDEEALEDMQAQYGSEANVNAVIDHEHRYAEEEIRIMRKLKGLSNIVCFEDSKIYPRTDTYGWDIIIRMERLVRLDEFLEKPSRFGYRWNLDMVLKIWTDLVTGLYYCERNGIVHMDIKPDNIFYTGSNMNLFKLGDFGVSIRSENGKVSAGIEAGTRAYMSPEIHSRLGGDVRSDIYSLAMVIYELLNDECLPFMGRHPSDAELDRGVEQRCTPGQEIPPIRDLDPVCSRILMRCLRYKPEERYQTMRELHADLQKYVMNRRPKSDPKPLPKWILPAIGIGTAGVLAVVGYMLFKPTPTMPLSLSDSALIDPATRSIVIRATTDVNAPLLLQGQKGERVRLDITLEGSEAPIYRNQIILNGSEPQSIWNLAEHALQDGKYQFIVSYPDKSDSQPLLLNAAVDRNVPVTPSIEGDIPFANVNANLVVRAETGATVTLYDENMILDTQTANSEGLVLFSRAFEANINYRLTATDGVGNVSAPCVFNAAFRQITAHLSEVNEDSEALEIIVDAGCEPRLVENGYEVLLESIDETHYRYVPPEGFVVSTVYVLTADDGHGAQATDEQTVSASPRRKIELSLSPEGLDDNGNIVGDAIAISGTAENDTQVNLIWNGESIGMPIQVVNGSFSAALNREDVGIDENGGRGRLSVKYTHGAASRASDELSVRWLSTVETEATVNYMEIKLTSIPMLATRDGKRIVNSATDGSLQLWLTDGSREMPVHVTLVDESDGETILEDSLELSSSGMAQINFYINELEDGSYTLYAAYQGQAERQYSWSIVVDRTLPQISIDAPSPFVGAAWTMRVSTEAGTSVALIADGVEIDTRTADDDGMAEFSYTFEVDVDYQISVEDACGNRASVPIVPEVKTVVASIDRANEDDTHLTFTIDPEATDFELKRNGNALDSSSFILQSDADGERVYAWQPPGGHLTTDDVFALTVWDRYGLMGSDEKTVSASAWREIGIRIDTETLNSQSVSKAMVFLSDGTPGETIEWRVCRKNETTTIKEGRRQLSTDSGACAISGVFGDLQDGDYTINICYSEQPDKQYSLDFAIDVTPPTLVINHPSPYIGATWTMNVSTEAGARVALMADGEVIDDQIASGDGTVTFVYTFEADVDYRISAEDACGNRASVSIVPEVKTVVASIDRVNEDDARLTFTIDPDATDFELKRNGNALDSSSFVLQSDADGGRVYAWQPPEGHLTTDDVFALMVWDGYGLTGSDEKTVSASAWREIGITLSTEILSSASVKNAIIELSDGTPGEWIDWRILRADRTTSIREGTEQLSTDSGACVISDVFSDLQDGDYLFVVSYMKQPEKQYSYGFAVDTTPPSATIDNTMPYANVDWVTHIETEPGTRVSLLVNGVTSESKQTDSNGIVEFNYMYKMDVKYAIQVTDASGNMSSVRIDPQVKTVVARIDPVNETDDRVHFTIDADAERFTLTYKGENIPESDIINLGAGQYTWASPENRFDVGETIGLTVTDKYGLEANDAQTVQEADWAKIELKVNNGHQGSNMVYRAALEVAGSAQANETIQLLWDGEPIGDEVMVGSDGVFAYALPIGETTLPETGGTGALSARYASGFAADRAALPVQVTWTPDETVALEVQPLSEDSEALVIDTEPNAAIEIRQMRNGVDVDSDSIENHNGHVEWSQPDGIFTKGDVFIVSVTDHAGNWDTMERRVAASSRRQIALEIANRFEWSAHDVPAAYALDTVIDRQLQFKVDAELDQALNVYINGEYMDTIAAGDVTARLDWDAVLNRLGSEPNAQLTLSVSYADGRAPGLAASRDVIWTPDDGVILDEANGALQLYRNGSLSIHTDPYAWVTVRMEGTDYDAGQANADGFCAWTPEGDYDIGVAYTVTVRDMFGHQRTSAEMVVEEVQRTAIDVETVERDDALLTLRGHAESGTTIAFNINDKRLTIPVSDDGAFALTGVSANSVGIASGDEVSIALSYADGASPSKTVALEPFVWDWKVGLSIDPVTEDSTEIVAHCGEPVTASLYLAYVGETEAEKVADLSSKDGDLRWIIDDLPVWLDRNIWGRIRVEDNYGNWTEQEFDVSATAYREIDLHVESDIVYDGMAAVTADQVRISGYAEPQHDVYLAIQIFDEQGDIAYSHGGTVVASGNGAYEYVFRLDDLESDIDHPWMLPAKGSRFLTVGFYPDSRHRAYSDTMYWDCKGPDLSVDGDILDKNWTSITGTTEVGARVEMRVDGEIVAETMAEQGSFVFKPSDVSSAARDFTGKTVRIIAYDSLNNASAPWERTVEAVTYPGQVTITNQAEDGSVSGMLHIEGWFAGFDQRDALLTVTADNAVVGVVSRTWEIRTMTADERAAQLGSGAGSYRESECCVFTADYDLSDAPTGSCKLVLSQDSYMGVQEIMSVPFTVVKSAEESRSLVVSAEAGAAIDVDAVESSFQSGDILLTGWCYVDGRYDSNTMLQEVRLSSVMHAISDVKLGLGYDVGVSEVISGGKNQWALADRDINKATSEAIRSQLPGVTASNNNAGFIIYLGDLGTTLPDGEYNVTIVAVVGGKMTTVEIGPIDVRINANAPAVSANRATSIASAWAPVVVQPSATPTP